MRSRLEVTVHAVAFIPPQHPPSSSRVMSNFSSRAIMISTCGSVQRPACGDSPARAGIRISKMNACSQTHSVQGVSAQVHELGVSGHLRAAAFIRGRWLCGWAANAQHQGRTPPPPQTQPRVGALASPASPTFSTSAPSCSAMMERTLVSTTSLSCVVQEPGAGGVRAVRGTG